MGINSLPNIQYLQFRDKEIYIKVTSNKGCSTISNFFLMRACFNNTESLTGIFFPQFITPNNDGFNDYWNVKGISDKMKQESIVKIFDKYGKLVSSFIPYRTIGWDGTYNGRELPPADYWYVFSIPTGYKKTGHITLKR